MDNKLYVSFGSKTETGSSKEFNTDALVDFAILDGHVFAVCDGHDGIGGHGALASKVVAESIKKYFFNRSYKEMLTALTNAVVYANVTLFEQSKKDPKFQGIGSTLAILIHRGGKIYYAYAGDSRIYWLRNDSLQLLTRDHVANNDDLVNAEVSVLLGKNKDIRFGVCKNPLTAEPGDLFLLCTDGLTDVIADDEILHLLIDQNTSAEHKSHLLMEKVKNISGKGAVSVQVIEFSQASVAEKTKRAFKLKPILVGSLIIVLVAAISYFGLRYYPEFVSQSDLPVTVHEQEAELNDSDEREPASAGDVAYPKDISNVEGIEHKEPSKPAPPIKSTIKKSNTKIAEPKVEKKQSGFYQHNIQAGENLYRIGLRYHVPQQKIIDINGSIATKLIAGQKLKIPITAIHKVGAGETLKSISAKYKVKINDIKSANKMEETKSLVLGEELVIPLP